MPRSRARAETWRIASKSNTSPRCRRTGDSTEMAPTAGGHPARGRALEDALHLLAAERRPAGLERDQVELGELLRAVARVVVEVARLLDDHPPLRATERAHREVVGEGARRHEDGGFLAQEAGELLLEGRHRPAARVVVFHVGRAVSRASKAAYSGGREGMPSPVKSTGVARSARSGRGRRARDHATRHRGDLDELPPVETHGPESTAKGNIFVSPPGQAKLDSGAS